MVFRTMGKIILYVKYNLGMVFLDLDIYVGCLQMLKEVDVDGVSYQEGPERLPSQYCLLL